VKAEITIGELSRRAGCNVETVRYYERIGLLPKARREQGGRFRRYDSDDVARLQFIRRSRQLGFTLAEARGVRSRARSLAAAHVADIRAKITDLQAMEAVLSNAICQCEAGRQTRCPLIEVLSGGVRVLGQHGPKEH
jgi:MerR family mercuric resistance operon transcriptional regulator